MKRRIVEIDEEKCNGCGACANACHESAIVMVNGKARLLKDDYCDGLGDCLPACPADAIRIVEREAADYDEEAVKARQAALAGKTAEEGNAPAHNAGTPVHAGCPGAAARRLHMSGGMQGGPGFPGMMDPSLFRAPSAPCGMVDKKELRKSPVAGNAAGNSAAGNNVAENVPAAAAACSAEPVSRLAQWPVQIRLAPVKADYFEDARLLIAADCSAYAYARFHEDFMKNRVTLIGCPKLDPVDYREKLTEIFRQNNIHSVTVVRMEVPCCGGLENAVKDALKASGLFVPWQVVTLGLDGTILDD